MDARASTHRCAIKRKASVNRAHEQTVATKSQCLYTKNGWQNFGVVRLDSLNVRDKDVGDCKGMPFFKEF